MGRGRYKGADIVLELARHFEWKYDFKVCGNQDREHREGFERLINVELTGFTPRVDAFSGVTIQIAPVRWSEPFGRTIPEAGWLGIPSIVSDRGGLPEAVGPGGLIIDDPEDLESWSDAIELLMENRTVWSELSLLAMSHSQRFKANIQVMELEGMLDGLCNKI
jgi:glycosyltransferase involved in cell wall biosynthesis